MNARTQRSPQRRGWTPQVLANALRAQGHTLSRATLQREARAGRIPHERTTGGHVRICAAWVAETFPGLSAAA